MKSGEADHGADDATRCHCEGGVEQRPLANRSSRALSAEAPPFRPRPQQFRAPPPLPAFHLRAQPPPFLFEADLNLLATGPEHQPFTQRAFPSGSRSPLHYSHGPSSPGLGRHRPPDHLAHTHPAAQMHNLRLPLHRRAYVPPKSQSLGPRSQPTASAFGAGTPKLSYIALAKHGSAACEEMRKWKSRMMNHLKGEDCYKGKASTSGVELEVQFHNILVKDKELALQLCNAQGFNDFWLHQAASEFFTESGVTTANRASFRFTDMPTRLTAASEVLKAKALSKSITVCNQAKTIEVATTHGRQTMDIIICGMLDKLAKGESWQGDISIEDMMLAEDPNGGKKLIITKESVVKENATNGERLDDLWSVWRAMQPFYLVRDRLPLYFGRLQKDLFNALHLLDWFVEYIRYHPAFYASNPRKNLICGIQLQACSKTKFNTSVSIYFSQAPFAQDWGKVTKEGVLHSISSFKKEKERKEKEKKERKEGVEEMLKGGEVVGMSDADQYSNTVLSLLAFQRNGLQHPYEHAVMSDKDEMELLLVATFEDFLPDLIGFLLSSGNMEGRFASDWSTYRASKSDDKEPPSVGGADSKEGH